MLFGGPVIGGDSLSRFFALHVFVIPGALLFFLAIHLWLVLKRGISAPPVAGQLVDPKTYDEDYEKELKTGVPFLGDAMLKDALCSSLAVIIVVVLAAVLGPKGPSSPPNPMLPGANPRPEWPFLWLFALLSLSPVRVRFGVQADEPLPRWLDLWPWFSWPALVVALFGVHRVLVRRKAPPGSTSAGAACDRPAGFVGRRARV